MITQGLTRSFLLEILQGIHQPGDVYRMALYGERAVLSELTTTYTTEGEVIGSPGYDAGGQVLTGYRAVLDGKSATLDFDDPSWPHSSITARGALLYNASRDNRAVVVIDFGKIFTSTNGSFAVIRPEPVQPLIRIR